MTDKISVEIKKDDGSTASHSAFTVDIVSAYMKTGSHFDESTRWRQAAEYLNSLYMGHLDAAEEICKSLADTADYVRKIDSNGKIGIDEEADIPKFTGNEREAILWLIDFVLGNPNQPLTGSRWPSALRSAKAKLKEIGHANPYKPGV